MVTNEVTDTTYIQYNTDNANWYNVTAGTEAVTTQTTLTGFFVTAWFWMNTNGTLYNYACVESIPWATGPTGPQGATGATGPTGPQGATGAIGLSTYDLAVAWWFTWSEVEFVASLRGPTGATGSLDFSTLSWTINLQNVVNIPTTDATLDENGFYFAITREKEWVTYIDWIGTRNIAVVIVFIIIIWRIFIYLTKREKRIYN